MMIGYYLSDTDTEVRKVTDTDMSKGLKNKEVWIRGILAFLGTYGICYLLKTAGMYHASFSIMSVPFMAVVFALLKWTGRQLKEIEDGGERRRKCLYAGIFSYLFSATMIAGYQLQTFGMTDLGVKGKGLLLLRAACLGIAVFPFGNLLFSAIEKIPFQGQVREGQREWKAWKVFAVSAFVIFLCLIPVWLAYYPIVMSYDFHRQFGEANGGFAYFWPYQPLAHTWVIWLFLQVGHLLGNIQTGIACMALFHMLVYSLTSGYACAFLYRVLKKRWAVAAGVLFFGIFPLNSVLVVCTTKDVLFSALFLLFMLLLAERSFFSTGRKQLLMDVLLLLEGSVMMQFRHNCIYAAAAFGILWVIFAGKKKRLRVLVLCILLVAGGKGADAAIKAAIGTTSGLVKIEMYSVPVQQFARVGRFHNQELDKETKETLEYYIPQECWEDYNPPISDSIKWRAGEGFSDLGQMLADWMHFAARYPNDFIDAFLELTRGYWFLDDRSYAECLGYGVEDRMGVIYTYNSSTLEDGTEILHESKLPWFEELLEEIVSGNAYYNWPIVSVLFKSAFYIWGLLVVWAAFFFRRQKEQAILCLFPLFYVGTMFLGPVVQMRYVFPIMLCLPVLICLLMIEKNGKGAE